MAGTIRADSIGGKVTAVAGNEATVSISSGTQPAPGDAVVIYFQLPGVEEEVLVGTGKVASITGGIVKVRIDDLKGTLQKDQLARIEAANPQPTSPIPSSSAAPPPARSPVYTPPRDYVPKIGTAASYNCDEGTGDILNDNSNNGRPMKLYGGLKFADGKTRKALDFKDSAKLYARREKDDTILNFADRDFTIELSCNFRSFPHEQVLLEKFSAKAGPGWTLTLLERTKLHFYAQGAGAFTAGVNLKPNQWYRFTVARRGSRLEMSVDEAVLVDEPISGSVVPSPNPLLLGRRNEQDGRGFPVNGLIDDIRIDVVPPRRE